MNKKISIALIMLIVVSICFAACSKGLESGGVAVTQVVTNENGEAVTDENGEIVTEVVTADVVTDSEGETVTEIFTNQGGEQVTTPQGEPITQVVTNAPGGNNSSTSKSDTTVSTIPKPDKPKNVTNLKSSDVKQTGLKLSWDSVKCKGYQIAYSSDGGYNWTYLEKAYTKTSYTVKNLTSYTEYKFRVRAYNENKAGISASSWASITVTTKADESISRKITVSLVLPNEGGKEDTITVYIDGKKDGTVSVKLDGSTITYTTEKKYDGLVTVKASLKIMGYVRAANTDKEECTIDFSGEGIKMVQGEDD